MHQRGTSLLEVVLVVAILVSIAIAFWSLSQGARAFGMQSAASQFDGALAYAQALASNSGNGATLVFDRRSSGDGTEAAGFVLTIYSGRPTGAAALSRAPLAPVTSIGDVRESALGSVPFTIFLNGAGHASGMSGAVNLNTVISNDPGCPAGERSIALTFSDPRASETRTIPCNDAIAGAPVNIPTAAP